MQSTTGSLERCLTTLIEALATGLGGSRRGCKRAGTVRQMSGPARVPLARLTAQLRELYRQRDDLMRSAGTVPTPPEEVSAVVDRYDRLLLRAATMLEVDIPA